MKKLVILGSTGSIGTQTLDIVRQGFPAEICGLCANRNEKLMEEQIREFHPKVVCMADEKAAASLRTRVSDLSVTVLSGEQGIAEMLSVCGANLAVAAMVGISGLLPVITAIGLGMDIALANKETLVAAGDLVMAFAKEQGVKILPVDSEHSAIFQCLLGGHEIKKILLTASGGPFFGRSKEELSLVRAQDALKHPNWDMGQKVTIDSSTLMNKGLEVIEACHLFGVSPDKIEVLVHRQSIIHSMVEFEDNSVIAQLGAPDMRTPISFALSYPERTKFSGDSLNFFDITALTFDKPDMQAFPCLSLAIRAKKEGGAMTAVLNGANESAVAAFLKGECGFLDIPRIVENAMENFTNMQNPTLQDILEADQWAKEFSAKKRI